MNYKLQLQKLQIKIDEENDIDLRKKLINQAIEIADLNKDLYESMDLRHILMDEEINPDNRIPILKEIIRLSDAANDLEESFDLRIQLIEEENYTSHCIDSFSAMTWLLEAVDSHPDLFEEEDVLWQYKWLACRAVNNADISLEQIQDILADLKMRLERNGYGLGAYYVPKIDLQESIGDISGALQTLKERDEYGRDGMSDCEACELNKKITIKLIAGDYDSAILDTKEMLFKGISCHEVPFDTYCNLAYYLNNVNESKAKEYFEKGLNEFDNDFESSFISGFSKLINYASYHNTQHALDLYQKYAHWQLNSEDKTNFDVCLNFLNLFKQKGTIELEKLNPSLPFYRADAKYNSDDLYNYYLSIAQNLAHKFDARNKTDNFKKLLTKEIMRK
ncbi:hypothetical protein [uncultured Apibacter sp.]|uniref:hypothetical protein n=1 Tax=uncultured Apibacter sp. TaxID=1778616 RepID=UPI0025D5DA19|nr:hypothetical protein [uncultured Apibacter sp.]